MRKTLLFALCTVIIGFTSCKDEETKPTETKEPTNAKAGQVVYTVNVVSGGNAINGRSSGIDQAKVTVAQQGTVTTVTTGTSGQASFPLMSTGIVTVTVEATDHATVHYTADLSDAVMDVDSIGSQFTRYGSTIVVMFATAGNTMSTVIGKVTCEHDSTNSVPPREEAIGRKITAVITGGAPTHAGVGKITSWTIESAVFSTTSVAQADGKNYTLTLPGTGDGLDIMLYADDFIATQFDKTVPGSVKSHSQDYTAAPILVKSISGRTKIQNINYAP